MTATSSPRHEGSDWMAGLGPFVGELLMTRPPGFYPSSPPSAVDSLANGDDRAETVVRILAICISEISRLADGPEILWPLNDRMAQSTEIVLHTTSSSSKRGNRNQAEGTSIRPDYEIGYERPTARLLAT